MAASIIAQEVGADLFLYDSGNDEVHVLNATAKLIYRLHEQGKNPEEIERAIRSTFQLEEPHRIQENIRECLEGLKSKGLIP
jgi:hypothetical protein